MNIVIAQKEHKKEALKMLDDFRTECNAIINPDEKYISTSAQEKGGEFYNKIIDSPDSAIFLAEESGTFMGITTINKIPQARYGHYIGEIEEMFVYPKYQGQGVAKQLLDTIIAWAKENRLTYIRLESGNELERAHTFYKKAGFEQYGQAYQLKI